MKRIILAAAFLLLSASAYAVVLQAPANTTTYIDRDGNAYPVSTTGQVTVPARRFSDAVAAGFTPTAAFIAPSDASHLTGVKAAALTFGNNTSVAPGVACTKGAATFNATAIMVCYTSNTTGTNWKKAHF